MDRPHDAFEEMVNRIMAISKLEEFAGATVIVPPEGEPLAFLTTDPAPDAVAFWGYLKARIEDRMARLAAEQQQQQGWQRR